MPDSSYQFVTSFNKAGQVGKYGVFVALIPELDLGFNVLAAGDVPANLNIWIVESLAGAFLPTWLAVSRRVANETYGGRYRSATLNSTMVIAAGDDGHPGLAVREWTSNGTDMLPIALSAGTYLNPQALPGAQVSIRLYPTGLEDRLGTAGAQRRRVAFKAIFEDLNQTEVAGMYSSDCATWVGQSGSMWGSLPLDQFVFELDGVVGAGGRARRVRNAALRADLDWVGGGGRGNITNATTSSGSAVVSSTGSGVPSSASLSLSTWTATTAAATTTTTSSTGSATGDHTSAANSG